VAVFAADHVYRMDVRQMVAAHVRSGAEVSVAALPVPIERASHFGVIATHLDGRIREFQEKPERPAQIPGWPSHAYASMGNYLFKPDVLMALLEEAAARGETDFGRDVLPRAIATHRVFAYDFASNRVPGILPHEEPNYWRDVGTIEAYRAAQHDASGRRPTFSLANERWPMGGGLRHAEIAHSRVRKRLTA
jgi:glucose-1-phosphate adenylyltransferase